MNLSRKSGVPLLPSHSCQPEGISAMLPDQATMNPVAREFPLSATPITLLTVEPLADEAGKRNCNICTRFVGTVVDTEKVLAVELTVYEAFHGFNKDHIGLM